MPALVGETIPGIRISDHPGRRRFVRNETRTRTPRRAPICGGPSGRVSRRHGPKRTPARAADRRVYAAPYPATANANTLTVHTITPAIVIRTVCFHMVSIPHFRLMLRGTLDQHNPARSDGRHRELVFRRLQKKEKPARYGNRCASRVYSPTRKARKTKSSFSRSVVSDHVCEKGRMSALGH